MNLSMVVGVAAPYVVGPSAWYADGMLQNGEQVRVSGHSLTTDKGQLVLIAVTKLLRKTRSAGHLVDTISVTAFESDVESLFEEETGRIGAGTGRTSRSFLRVMEGIQLTWELRPDPDVQSEKLA